MACHFYNRPIYDYLKKNHPLTFEVLSKYSLIQSSTFNYVIVPANDASKAIAKADHGMDCIVGVMQTLQPYKATEKFNAYTFRGVGLIFTDTSLTVGSETFKFEKPHKVEDLPNQIASRYVVVLNDFDKYIAVVSKIPSSMKNLRVAMGIGQRTAKVDPPVKTGGLTTKSESKIAMHEESVMELLRYVQDSKNPNDVASELFFGAAAIMKLCPEELVKFVRRFSSKTDPWVKKHNEKLGIFSLVALVYFLGIPIQPHNRDLANTLHDKTKVAYGSVSGGGEFIGSFDKSKTDSKFAKLIQEVSQMDDLDVKYAPACMPYIVALVTGGAEIDGTIVTGGDSMVLQNALSTFMDPMNPTSLPAGFNGYP